MMSASDFVAQARQHIQECTLNDALALIEQGAIVVDVREPQEFMSGHIPRAVELPRGVIEFKASEHPALSRKTDTLLVYCQAGGRGALAAQTLGQMGFAQVINLQGGFNAWVEAKQPVEKDPAEWG